MASIANPHKGEFEIKIGGRPRIMRFGFDQLAQLEERIGGRSIIAVMQSGNFGLLALREALYVGLALQTPGLTVAHITRWIEKDFSKLNYYMECVAKAITLAFPRKPGAPAVEPLDDLDDDLAEGAGPLGDDDPEPAAAPAVDMATQAAVNVSREAAENPATMTRQPLPLGQPLPIPQTSR